MNDSVLRNELVRLLRCGQAHAIAKQALDGLKPEMRNVGPVGIEHSIWEEFEHMRLA